MSEPTPHTIDLQSQIDELQQEVGDLKEELMRVNTHWFWNDLIMRRAIVDLFGTDMTSFEAKMKDIDIDLRKSLDRIDHAKKNGMIFPADEDREGE